MTAFKTTCSCGAMLETGREFSPLLIPYEHGRFLDAHAGCRAKRASVTTDRRASVTTDRPLCLDARHPGVRCQMYLGHEGDCL